MKLQRSGMQTGRRLLLLWSFTALALAQAKHPVSGRVIAPVMSAAGADWLDRGERESEENPAKALTMLEIQPGMTVCDLGAGSGYYTVRLSRLVGPAGKVYAVDIQQRMLDLLDLRLKRQGIGNVITVRGGEQNPNLPPNSQDLILLVDVYHEFAHPQQMLRRMREALKDNGRLVLLEYRAEDPAVPIRPEHKMSIAQVRMELEPEGFVVDRVLDGLPWQHIFICRKK